MSAQKAVITKTIGSLEEGRQFVEREVMPRLKRPVVILLSGGLGAGKTQVVRWIVEFLGRGEEEVSSPTFAIHHRYSTKRGSVDHLDLYRLENDSELDQIGLWDMLKDPQGLLLIEWADRLPADVWPNGWQRVSLDVQVSNGARIYSLNVEP